MKVILALAAALLALLPTLVAAHPLGNFTVSRFTHIQPGADGIALRFVVDMAEIPTFQELSRLDAADGRLSPARAEAYARQRADELRRTLSLTVDGRPLALTVVDARASLAEGQGGLATLRLEVDYRAPYQPGALAYRDDSYGDRLGWREVVLSAGPGVAVADADVPAESISDELRAYPDALLSAPLNRRTAAARLSTGAGAATAPAAAGAERPRLAVDPLGAIAAAWPRPLAAGSEAVTALARVELTWPLLLGALAAASGFGMMHALSPGHGKTVVAAYLVGARGTPWHALVLGLTVTATHTWGVFALGLLTLYADRLVDPERLYPWLALLSGLLVVAMGLTLLRSRLRRAPAHHHDHDHDHDGMHSHDGVHYHSHAPAPNLGWRGTIMLGVVGGLLPCPSALILMLASIALGRVALGLGLVVAFSAGLAVVLMAIGLLFVYARGWLDRLARTRTFGGPRPLRLATRLLPIASAVAVTLAGLVISAGALPGVLGS